MTLAPLPSESRAGAPGPGSPLLQPLALGRVVLPTRIVFGAHLTNFGHGNLYTERHRAYYAERAAGGAGLIVAEAMTVHPQDWPYEHVPFGHREAVVPSLKALGGAVREANPDTVLLAQLNHTGGQCAGRLLRQSPWAPSPMVDVASKRVAREMLAEEIAQVVAGFGAAAARVVGAGWAGVEVNAGQWSLVRQFLSALTNQREDPYGGDADRRARFLLEVVEAVRHAIGTDAVLGVKLCGDELAPWGGLTPQDAEALAGRLAAQGALDYLSLEIGGPYSTHLTDAAMPTAQGFGAHLAGPVRAALRKVGSPLAVFAEGRIESVEFAERLIATGEADGCVMTRALLSDPRLPRKLAARSLLPALPEDAEPVRPHVGHLRYFCVRGDWNRPVGDLANPRAGREALLQGVQPVPEARPPSAPDGRPVLVIGGGPAGCEAAITLARQGWAVTLVEARSRPGGWAARLAETCVAREEFAPLVAYHAALLERWGVEVHLGLRLSGDEAQVAGRPWDAYARIYVAVGAEAPPSELRTEAATCAVVTARALLDDPAPPLPVPGAAVVVDTEYGFRMGNAVEWLLARNWRVDVVSPDLFVGRELVESSEFLWFQRVAAARASGLPPAVLRPRLAARLLRGKALLCADRFSGQETVLEPLDLVVLAQPEVPAAALYDALARRHPAVQRIGDARAPRQMGEAIAQAYRTVVATGEGEGSA
jgi:2,4-dienoyl-CoA reductase-like NADH-dependent reductase (Old Yellow Enzyme family)